MLTSGFTNIHSKAFLLVVCGPSGISIAWELVRCAEGESPLWTPCWHSQVPTNISVPKCCALGPMLRNLDPTEVGWGGNLEKSSWYFIQRPQPPSAVWTP